MLNSSAETLEYDICGQICPSTLLIALREVNRHQERLRAGSLQLCFRTDNRDATITIPDAVKNMGYSARVSKRDADYVIVIGLP